MTNETTTLDTAIVAISDEQASMVAGGALPSPIFRAGCPSCCSGLQVAFQNLVTTPVLPGQQVAIFG